MSYCLNPRCEKRLNPDERSHCHNCGSQLLIEKRYRLIRPLRELEEHYQTEIFEIDDGGTTKVLKVLTNHHPQWVELFERQAKVLQQLQHPGIPGVDPDGYFTVALKDNSRELHCLVMDFIVGQNLEQWLLQNGPISEDRAIDWLTQIAEILEQLHQNKLFHRDIKPSNIMLNPKGQLVLVDFGTVRKITGTYMAKIGGGLPVTGTFSPGYTPLEQVDGRAIPQSDFYSLGRTLVYLLTGKHPLDLHQDESTGQLLWRDTVFHLSPAFGDLVDRLMSPFPGNRPQTAQLILQSLQGLDRTAPPPLSLSQQRDVWWLIVINAGLAIALAIACMVRLQAWHQNQQQSSQAAALHLQAWHQNQQQSSQTAALHWSQVLKR